ncbi:transposase [Streptomyces sp. NPDC051041]|uniref:transposase n=1 Tax=Streptomyces sp. NPDC051041 TaxID=3365640 RepID=UPI003791B567
MLSRGDPTDEEWAVTEPLLPVSCYRCGRWRDHRQVINGIIHRPSTGVQWRELPQRFRPWQAVHKRHLLWSADGTWNRLLQHVQALADTAGDIDWNVNVDSTSVRAHQHAAGAPKRASSTSPNSSKDGAVKVRPGAADSGEPARSAGGNQAAVEGTSPRLRQGAVQTPQHSGAGRRRERSTAGA